MTTICRIGFCEECFRTGRPQGGQKAILYGGKSEKYKFHTCTSGWRGFTPHIFVLLKADENVVTYKKICCINDCGAFMHEGEKVVTLYLNQDKWVFGTMPTKQWNALVMFKDTGLKI